MEVLHFKDNAELVQYAVKEKIVVLR